MMMMLVHENYFDVVMEENLLVVIRTRILKIIFRIKTKISDIVTFFSICVWEDNADAIVRPRILSKWDDDDDELKEFVCWLLRRCCCCFINNCCVNDDDDDDDGDEDGCPIVVHCFPPPTEPNRDEVFEPIVDGTVDTPPLLLTCK